MRISRAPLLAWCGLVIAGCGRSEARKRAEIESCSTITLDGAGIASCLVAQYRWKTPQANAAGQAPQRELDSLATHQRDSLWYKDAARHSQELAQCTSRAGDVARCLTDNYAWEGARATAAFDSLWKREGPRHRQEVNSCQRRRNSNLASCLMLYFKWDPKHAFALDDSLARAKVRGMNR